MGIKTNTDTVISKDFLNINNNIINKGNNLNSVVVENKVGDTSGVVEEVSLDDFFVGDSDKKFSDGLKEIFGQDEEVGFVQLLANNNVNEYTITDLNQLNQLQKLYGECYNTPLDLLNYEVGDSFFVIYRGGLAPFIKFDNIYLENNLNNNIKEVISNYPTGKEGFVNDYSSLLNSRLSDASTNRERAVATALFFALDFPKLEYNYGGCHELSSNNDFSADNIIKILADGDSFDCSSLLTCCFKSGGLSVSDFTTDKKCAINSWDIEKMPAVSLDSGQGKPGDAVYFEGKHHVGIIVGVNENKKELAIVHSSDSGEGTSILIVDSETGKVKTNYGTESDGMLTPGSQYFTHIVSIDYGDTDLVGDVYKL